MKRSIFSTYSVFIALGCVLILSQLNCSPFISQYSLNSGQGWYSLSSLETDNFAGSDVWEKSLFASGESHSSSSSFTHTSYSYMDSTPALKLDEDGAFYFEFSQGLGMRGIARMDSAERQSQVVFRESFFQSESLQGWSLLKGRHQLLILTNKVLRVLDLKTNRFQDLTKHPILYGEMSQNLQRYNFVDCETAEIERETAVNCHAKTYNPSSGVQILKTFLLPYGHFPSSSSKPYLFFQSRNLESNEATFFLFSTTDLEKKQLSIQTFSKADQIENSTVMNSVLSDQVFAKIDGYYYPRLQFTKQKSLFSLADRMDPYFSEDPMDGAIFDSNQTVISDYGSISPDQASVLFVDNKNTSDVQISIWKEVGFQQFDKFSFSAKEYGFSAINYLKVVWSADSSRVVVKSSDHTQFFFVDLKTRSAKLVNVPTDTSLRLLESSAFFSPSGNRLFVLCQNWINQTSPAVPKNQLHIFSNTIDLVSTIDHVKAPYSHMVQRQLHQFFQNEDFIWPVNLKLTRISPSGQLNELSTLQSFPVADQGDNLIFARKINEFGEKYELSFLKKSDFTVISAKMPAAVRVRSISAYGWFFDSDDTTGMVVFQSDYVNYSDSKSGPGNPGFTVARMPSGDFKKFDELAVKDQGFWGSSYSASIVLKNQSLQPIIGFARNQNYNSTFEITAPQYQYQFATFEGEILQTFPEGWMRLVSPDKRWAIIAFHTNAPLALDQPSVVMYDAFQNKVIPYDILKQPGMTFGGGGNGVPLGQDHYLFSVKNKEGDSFAIGKWSEPGALKIFEKSFFKFYRESEQSVYFGNEVGQLTRYNLQTAQTLILGDQMGSLVALSKESAVFKNQGKLLGLKFSNLNVIDLTDKLPIGIEFSFNGGLQYQYGPFGKGISVSGYVTEASGSNQWTARYFDENLSQLPPPDAESYYTLHPELKVLIERSNDDQTISLKSIGDESKSVVFRAPEYTEWKSLGFVPNKAKILFTVIKNETKQLMLFDGVTGAAKVLAVLPELRAISGVKFSPDGSSVVLRSNALSVNAVDLFKFSLD